MLDLADVATGERAVSTGRGTAHELRLLFEGVTGIGEAARAGRGELIAWTVGELLEAFYRGGGKVRRSGERPSLSDPVVFDVRLPPGAGPGPTTAIFPTTCEPTCT